MPFDLDREGVTKKGRGGEGGGQLIEGGDYFKFSVKGGDYLREAIHRGVAIIRGNTTHVNCQNLHRAYILKGIKKLVGPTLP